MATAKTRERQTQEAEPDNMTPAGLAHDPLTGEVSELPEGDPLTEYEAEELETTYVSMRITAGTSAEKPGDIHLEKAGQFFMARFDGLHHPEGWDRPILHWRMGASRWYSPCWRDVVDKIERLCDQKDQHGMPFCSDPPLLRVTFLGEEKIASKKGPAHTINRFKVEVLKAKVAP